MPRMLSRLFGLTAVAGVAALAPVTMEPSADGAGVIRLKEACGQKSGVTECVYTYNYICVTSNGNEKNYKCSQGCSSFTGEDGFENPI